MSRSFLKRSPGCRSMFRQMMLMSVVLPFTGCTLVGPDFKEPTAPVAGSFTGIDGKPTSELDTAGSDQSRQATAPASQEQLRDWWTVFHDATLDQLIDNAYKQNLTLLSAGTRVLEAQATLGVAIGEFYPQQQRLGASVEYDRLSKVDALAAGTPTNFWRALLGYGSSWELDFWGKFRRGIESADAAFLASIANYDDVLVTLLGNVATTYIGVRTLEKQIELANTNIGRQRKALNIAQDRFKNGATTRLDVYQAQNVLGATQATVPALEIQRQEGINALHVLLGMPPGSLDKVLAQSAGIPAPPAGIQLGMPADLLRRRPDIRHAELQAAAQSAQIGVAKADLFPSFSLVGSVGLVSSNVGSANLGDILTAKSLAYSFGPTVQWNIFNYGQITNNVRVQDARLETLLVDYKNTVLKAQQEVQDGIASYVLSRSEANFLQSSVTAASGALDLSFVQYQEGLSDFTTVLAAEQNVLQAENNLALTTGQTATSLAAIYRALGGGWEIRAGKDFVPPSTKEEMKERTNWGSILQASSEAAPPSREQPADAQPTQSVRPPSW